MNEKTNKRRQMKGVALNFSKYLFLMVLPFLYQSCSTRSNDKKAEQDVDSTEITSSDDKKEMSAFEKNGLKEGFYEDNYRGFYFMIPQFLKDGTQKWDLHNNRTIYGDDYVNEVSYSYDNDGRNYSMYITISKRTMEDVLWEEYDRDRHDCGDTTWDEIKNNQSNNTLTTITDNYIIADNNDGEIALFMKNGELCGHVTFIYPEGGKEIAEETIRKTLDATTEGIRQFGQYIDSNTNANTYQEPQNNGPRRICVTLDAEIVYNADIEPVHQEAILLNGNYGADFVNFAKGNGEWVEKCVRTNVITIPQGKMWVFEKQETQNNKMYGPFIIEGGHLYNCERNANSSPTFRSGQQIFIRANPYLSGREWSIHTNIYFIEKDDDLYVQ